MNRLDCFSKKDAGGVVLFGVVLAEIVLAVLLLLSTILADSFVMIAICAIGMISGFGYVAAYIANSRSKFRPCWFLSIGFLIFSVCAFGLISGNTALSSYGMTLNTTVMIISVFLGIISISTAIQLYYLRLKRWIILVIFGICNFLFVLSLYFNLFGLREQRYIPTVVLCFLFATQTLFESFLTFNLKKD